MVVLNKHYWDLNYSEPKTIDGIGNAKDHSRYLSAFFNIEGIQITGIIDLGFGTGHLFKEMLRTFKPIRAAGLEPSTYIFKKFKAPKGVQIFNQDILSWAKTKNKTTYDLALCTSVLQYLSDQELKVALPVIARRVSYLYLTVPTDVEYRRQKSELKFSDPYARIRTRKQYLKLLAPHFTFLSTRILESKHFYDEDNTPFNDLLFRF